jgi:putative ABC transport system permease protein
VLQAVILKALGATRRRILLSHMAEYLLLACLTSFIALLVGSISAWATLARVMELEFVFSATTALQTLVLANFLVLLFGGFGTLRVLQARPAVYLRSE